MVIMNRENVRITRTAQASSKLLSDEDNATVLDLIPDDSQALSVCVAQVLLTDPPHKSWKRTETGALVLIKDYTRRTYFIRFYNLTAKSLTWEQELYPEMEYYLSAAKTFHMFEADRCMVGLNFANFAEAWNFSLIVRTKLGLLRHRYRQRRSPGSSSSKRASARLSWARTIRLDRQTSYSSLFRQSIQSPLKSNSRQRDALSSGFTGRELDRNKKKLKRKRKFHRNSHPSVIGQHSAFRPISVSAPLPLPSRNEVPLYATCSPKRDYGRSSSPVVPQRPAPPPPFPGRSPERKPAPNDRARTPGWMSVLDDIRNGAARLRPVPAAERTRNPVNIRDQLMVAIRSLFGNRTQNQEPSDVPRASPHDQHGTFISYVVMTDLNDIGFRFVITCMNIVETKGILNEGLYRTMGVVSKTIQLLQSFLQNFETVDLWDEDKWELLTISSAVKAYFRRLPEPLLTFQLYTPLIEASKIEDKVSRLTVIRALVLTLPKTKHRLILEILMRHLANVAANSGQNRMTAANLACCFGPTLLKPKDKNSANLGDIHCCNIVIKILIKNCQQIFSEGTTEQATQILTTALTPENCSQFHQPLAAAQFTNNTPEVVKYRQHNVSVDLKEKNIHRKFTLEPISVDRENEDPVFTNQISPCSPVSPIFPSMPI